MTFSSRIPRLYIDAASLAPGDNVTLDAGQSHYLGNVLRLGRGDGLRVFNGSDGEFMAEIAGGGKKSLALSLGVMTLPQPPMPSLMVVFAPVKKTRLDFIVEKSTELGAGILQPVLTGFTSVARVNTARMRKTAIEAAEQTGRLTVPECREPMRFPELLAGWPDGRHIVFCDETRAGEPAHTIAGRIRGMTGEAAILIGPEGGFTDGERAMLGEMKNAVAVSLGGNILRADTAAVAALAVWQAVAGEWKAPER